MRSLVLLAASLLLGCGTLPWTSSEPAEPKPFPGPEELYLAEGLEALEIGDFPGAEDRFRRLAYRCEAGEEGRKGLILLATLELDARNPAGRPDEAARLAAVYLNLPEAPAEERALARTLYFAAVDRGGAPVQDTADLVDPAAVAAREAVEGPVPAHLLPPARRFTQCQGPPPEWAGVPEYPGVPTAEALRRARAQGGAARQLTDSLAARVEALEAELARIRKLLRGGGGGGGGGAGSGP